MKYPDVTYVPAVQLEPAWRVMQGLDGINHPAHKNEHTVILRVLGNTSTGYSDYYEHPPGYVYRETT